MSALTGALTVAGVLVVEEVLVTSKGGPAAVGGIFGAIVKAIDRFADPTIPAIPDHSKTSPSQPPPTKPSITGPGTTNPLQAPPPGSSAPPRDYNPSQVGGGKFNA